MSLLFRKLGAKNNCWSKVWQIYHFTTEKAIAFSIFLKWPSSPMSPNSTLAKNSLLGHWSAAMKKVSIGSIWGLEELSRRQNNDSRWNWQKHKLDKIRAAILSNVVDSDKKKNKFDHLTNPDSSNCCWFVEKEVIRLTKDTFIQNNNSMDSFRRVYASLKRGLTWLLTITANGPSANIKLQLLSSFKE